MNSILNLFPKKYKPDYVFLSLFLHQMPQTLRDHLLAQDIQDSDALAKNADALFQELAVLYSSPPFGRSNCLCLRN